MITKEEAFKKNHKRHLKDITPFEIQKYITDNEELTNLITNPYDNRNLYLYKQSTGIGGTHLLLSDTLNNTLIVTPTKGVILGKETDYRNNPNKYNNKKCFFICSGSDHSLKDVIRYMKYYPDKKISVMSTTNQVEKERIDQIDNFENLFSSFNLFIDEVHLIITQSSFRPKLLPTFINLLERDLFKRKILSTATPNIIGNCIMDLPTKLIPHYMFINVSKSEDKPIEMLCKDFIVKKSLKTSLEELVVNERVSHDRLLSISSNSVDIGKFIYKLTEEKYQNVTPHYLCGDTYQTKIQPYISNPIITIGKPDSIDINKKVLLILTSSFFEGYDIQKKLSNIIVSSDCEISNLMSVTQTRQVLGRGREGLYNNYLLIDKSIDNRKLSKTNQASRYINDVEVKLDMKDVDSISDIEDYFIKFLKTDGDYLDYYKSLSKVILFIEFYCYKKPELLKERFKIFNINLTMVDTFPIEDYNELGGIKVSNLSIVEGIQTLEDRLKSKPLSHIKMITDTIRISLQNQKYYVENEGDESEIVQPYKTKQMIGNYSIKIFFIYYMVYLRCKYPNLPKNLNTRDSKYLRYLRKNFKEISSHLDNDEGDDLNLLIHHHIITKYKSDKPPKILLEDDDFKLIPDEAMIKLLFREQPLQTSLVHNGKYVVEEYEKEVSRRKPGLNYRQKVSLSNKIRKEIYDYCFEDLQTKIDEWNLRDFYNENPEIIQTHIGRLEDNIESMVDQNIMNPDKDSYVFRTKGSLIDQYLFTLRMFLCRGRGTYHYGCNKDQDRIYTPFVNLLFELRGNIPLNLVEYDKKVAYPTFISEIYSLPKNDDLYLNIMKNDDISYREAKVKYNTILNTWQDRYGNKEKAIKFFVDGCGYNESIVRYNLIPDVFEGKGSMFKRLVKMERQHSELAQNLITETSLSHNIFNLTMIRLHDAVYLIKEEIEPIEKKLDKLLEDIGWGKKETNNKYK